VEARGTLPNDATLLSFFPHMHLRGKRFEYNIVHREKNSSARSDQEIEPLLDVHYHFHWQMSYRLAEPRTLKAGTELLMACRGVIDAPQCALDRRPPCAGRTNLR
jgi:hypothetical protein